MSEAAWPLSGTAPTTANVRKAAKRPLNNWHFDVCLGREYECTERCRGPQKGLELPQPHALESDQAVWGNSLAAKVPGALVGDRVGLHDLGHQALVSAPVHALRPGHKLVPPGLAAQASSNAVGLSLRPIALTLSL